MFNEFIAIKRDLKYSTPIDLEDQPWIADYDNFVIVLFDKSLKTYEFSYQMALLMRCVRIWSLILGEILIKFPG